MYKNIKINSKLTEARHGRYPAEVHDTPDKEGYYRGVGTTWLARKLKDPDIELHYDAFRSPRFVIRANGKRLLGTDDSDEAKSFLRSNFNIRWDERNYI